MYRAGTASWFLGFREDKYGSQQPVSALRAFARMLALNSEMTVYLLPCSKIKLSSYFTYFLMSLDSVIWGGGYIFEEMRQTQNNLHFKKKMCLPSNFLHGESSPLQGTKRQTKVSPQNRHNDRWRALPACVKQGH